jgi:MarR family 2-MHQ and catechol resistance regulon transcriptional repressor
MRELSFPETMIPLKLSCFGQFWPPTRRAELCSRIRRYIFELKYFEFKPIMTTTTRYGKKADLALATWVKLARAFSVFDHRTIEQIRTFGLTQAQFGVLETLGHKGSLTLGELCRKQLVSGGNMTVVVDNLERRGLVERIRSREDRRSIGVQLTAKGLHLFERIFPQHAEHVANITSVLTEHEQVELGALLKKLGMGITHKGSNE